MTGAFPIFIPRFAPHVHAKIKKHNPLYLHRYLAYGGGSTPPSPK